MKLALLGGGDEPVFRRPAQDGQTLLTRQIEMQNGDGQCEIDLPPELYGTIEINAYRSAPMGCPCASRAWRTFGKHCQLVLNATMDQPEYRPGARAKSR